MNETTPTQPWRETVLQAAAKLCDNFDYHYSHSGFNSYCKNLQRRLRRIDNRHWLPRFLQR